MNSPILSDAEERLHPGVAARAASLSPPSSTPPQPPNGPDTPPPQATRRRVIAKRYRIDELLGEGGMAVVYRGWHLPLDEPIAIKILKQEYAENEEAVTRFLQEARAGALLRGKSVAQVLDIGRLESGPPFMVTELLSGRDLQELLEAQGRFAVRTALQLMKEICSAVSEIHECGIVHRDLKPANIFLARDANGEPLIKLLDFGIAKRLDGNDLNDTKNSLGSPHYMAPEQIMSAKEVDEQADIWSLGIVLFELLTGRVPFDADTIPAQCAQVLNAPCPSPAEFVPELSPELCAVVLRCLEKEPSARYATALELRQALEEFETPEVHDVPESELAVPITVCLPPAEVESDDAPLDETTTEAEAIATGTITQPRPRRRSGFVAAVMMACAAIIALSFSPTRDLVERAYGATETAVKHSYASATRALAPWFGASDAPEVQQPSSTTVVSEAPTAVAPASRAVSGAIPSNEVPATMTESRLRMDSAKPGASGPDVQPSLAPPAPAPVGQRAVTLKAPRYPSATRPRTAPSPRQHPDTAIERRYVLTPTPPTPGDLINPYPDMPLK